jgi:pimeloyl-ACP methyl ester carboxylesterase
MRRLAKLGLRGTIPETELRRITVPVSLIWGRRDPLTPLQVGETLSGALDWPLHVVEDAGHLPHIERPDGFVRALRTAMAAH